jgi:Dolichyl-phosphate-mannose-protein mannosyltransferase
VATQAPASPSPGLPGPDPLSRRLGPLSLEAAAVLGLVLLGAALRLQGLSDYWLNPDEGIYYAVAHLPAWPPFWAEIAANAHPPLFYLVLRGLGGLSPEPLLLRLPALVCGCLAIHAFALGTRRLAGPAAGLFAAAVAATAPGLVIQSQVIRPYTMQIALLAYGGWLLLRALDTGRQRDLAGAAGLLLAACLTHYGSIAIVLAMGATLAGAAALGRLPWRQLVWGGLALAPGVVAFAASYVLHIHRVLEPQWLGPGFYSAYDPLLHHDLAGLWSGVVGVDHYVFGPRLGALATLLVLGGLGALLWRRRLVLPAVALGALGVAAVMSLAGRYPFGSSRHSLYLATVLVPSLAAGLDLLLVRRPARALAAAAALALLAAFPAPARYLVGTRTVHITPEKVLPARVLAAHAPLLEAASRDHRVLLMDKQTYFMLMPYLRVPYLREIRDSPDTLGEARVARVAWRDTQLVVSSAWVFALDDASWRAPTHILSFLRTVDAAYPDLELRHRRDGLLLFGGWNTPYYRALPALGRDLGGDPPCVSDFRARAGLGSARLDAASCLARPPVRRG